MCECTTFRWFHGSFWLSTTVLSVIFASGVATAVRAEVRVEGTVAVVHITTNRDAVTDVLAALGTTFVCGCARQFC